jgi:hypothetical protein
VTGVVLPARLNNRPKDRRGLPIPFVQALHADGTPDFTAVDAGKAWEAGRQRRCGLCGEPLDYWIAFVGGPRSARHRQYLDPPMHSDCAFAALELCPHLAVQRAKRARKVSEGTHTPDGFDETKPDEWVVYETRGYTQRRLYDRGGRIAGYVFEPDAAKRLHVYHYTDGRLRPAVSTRPAAVRAP